MARTERPPYRAILSAIADTVESDGLHVGDLPEAIQCWIADDEGDELRPDVICRLTTGENARWWNEGRVELRGAIRIARFARTTGD